MVIPNGAEDSDSEEYQDSSGRFKKRRNVRKRRKLTTDRAAPAHREPQPVLSLEPLLSRLIIEQDEEAGPGFETIMQGLLPELLHSRAIQQEQELHVDEQGRRLRNLTRAEVVAALGESNPQRTAMLTRKLKSHRDLRTTNKANIDNADDVSTSAPILSSQSTSVNTPAIEALDAFQSTPYHQSFLSRLHGIQWSIPPDALAVDWETSTPWMKLMSDIREHYSLAQLSRLSTPKYDKLTSTSSPEREQPTESVAPIVYAPLNEAHLPQVHDLLSRTFWPGIDDSLQISPKRCTVVATYKRLVVGIAIMSSPQETYITYLAVKPGWDNAHIARSMLYHLITLNPKRDITLHVSTNNSAMLLYNRFGFKAEEFVAGFYEDYLSPQSCQSKNAFRLRLRQQ